MSVIINEMDVATAPPPESAPTAPAAAAASGPKPIELRETIRHLADRHERVRAD